MGSYRENRQLQPAFADWASNVEEIRKACNIEDPHGKQGPIPRNALFRKKPVGPAPFI